MAAEGSARLLEWPRCAYCGSPRLRESHRTGLHVRLLRLVGCTVYRCESCERRFAFAPIGHPERRRKGERVKLSGHRSDVKTDDRIVILGARRRLIGLLATLLAALISFVTATWMISRSERRRLEGEPSPPP